MSESTTLCECGHPYEAHRVNYGGRPGPGGRGTMQQSCIATVTRRHEHGDDSWPCPCRDFKKERSGA